MPVPVQLVAGFLVVGVMFGLLLLMRLSRRRWEGGGSRDLPVLSGLSEWLFATRNPSRLIFAMIIALVGILFLLNGCHLVWIGPPIFWWWACP